MEELIPILVLVGYAVLTLLGRLIQSKRNAGEETKAEPSTVDRMLREMMRQSGIEPEPVVATEHRRTPSEHRPTVSEHRQDASEKYGTVSEHRRTVSETRFTPSEHVPRASEHRVSPGEHLKGDLPLGLPPIPKASSHKRERRRSKLAEAVVSDLRGGAHTLGRAIVLREILGPPVSLRSPDERA